MPYLPYEQISTTARSAEVLAQRHGAENLEMFAASLPENARVLDVGAGDSTLGQEVTVLRQDIEWTSLDFTTTPRHLQEAAPDNLHYVTGDATRLGERYQPGQFNYVASYWLLPHLPKQERLKALGGMYGILAVKGTLSVGPYTSPADDMPKGVIEAMRSLKAPAVQIEKTPYTTVDEAAALIARLAAEICVPAQIQRMHGAYQKAVAELMGTSRHFVRDASSGIKMIYDQRAGQYTPAFRSPQGLLALGAIARRTMREYYNMSKETD